jgi:serine protease AprX
MPTPRPGSKRSPSLARKAAALLIAGLWLPAALQAAPLEGAAKIAPQLLQAASVAPADSVTAWVSFADKGESGPGDLARRLAEAAALLSPRARARRIRAHVRPLVDYLDLPVNEGYLRELTARGLAPYGVSRWFNRVAVRAPAGALVPLAALRCVSGLAAVERMRPSRDPEPTQALARPARATAGSIDYGQTLSQLAQINVPSVHDSGYTGSGVLICVLDEGFNYFDQHEALRDQSIPADHQRDFLRGLQTVQDTLDPGMVHGTWVLGVLAGRKFGTYVGAAFDAQYALARTEVRSFERPQEMVYWGDGAEWADSLGADIISSSLGYSTFDTTTSSYTYADMDGHTTLVTRAAEIAASKGILVVNAAGNEGNNAWHYLLAPSDANGDSVLGIGAVDANGIPAGFSSYGPSADGRVKPDLAALGVSNPVVNAFGFNTSYGTLSGTSFATPLVAGLAACIMQARPQWTPRDVIRALRYSASQSSHPDYRVGYGIPNGAIALQYDPLAGVGTPPRLTLRLAGPNPVAFDRGPARITLALPDGLCGRPARLRVLDAQGRRIRELWSGVVSCGLALTVPWDGLDEDGRAVAPGLYWLDAQAGGEHASVRLVGLR